MSKSKILKLPDGVMFTIQGNEFTFKLNKDDKSIKFFKKIMKYFFKNTTLYYKSQRCDIVSISDNLNDSVDNDVTFELYFSDRRRQWVNDKLSPFIKQ